MKIALLALCLIIYFVLFYFLYFQSPVIASYLQPYVLAAFFVAISLLLLVARD